MQFDFLNKFTLKQKLIFSAAVLIVLALVLFFGVFPRGAREGLDNLRNSSEVYDRNGELIGNIGYASRRWVPLDRIATPLQQAVISIEDARFYKHHGLDFRGIARAMFRNILPGGTLEGGSTITQQLAKIALLSSKRTIIRKVKDMSLAVRIDQIYSKEEILELYLNSIYLAHGNVGVESAAQFFFGKSASKLNLQESALLAGMIRSPENYSPLKNREKAKVRRDLVLDKMQQYGYIDEAQCRKAKAAPLGIFDRDKMSRVGSYFIDYIQEYLMANEGFSESELLYGGYKIYTTLDLKMQREAEKTMLKLPVIKGVTEQPQGALVSLEVQTGEILAMVGGRNYFEAPYNRAVKSFRQPGSTIKPFVYVTALANGFNAASRFVDEPLEIKLPGGQIWHPENYSRTYSGVVSMREAIRESLNTVAVLVLQEVGINTVASQIELMGIKSLVRSGTNNDLNLAPLALGGLTKGVTPLEWSGAYAAFANGGIYTIPHGIRKIINKQGTPIKEYNDLESRQVISEPNAYIMTNLMQDVVEQGTGRAAALGERPVAGKTGTSSDNTNAWFVGYTPQMVTAIWIGNDRQDKPMKYKGITIGSGAAARLWREYMAKATANQPILDFVEPPGIVWANIDAETGKAVGGIAGLFNDNVYKEVFSEDSVPEGKSKSFWNRLLRRRNRDKLSDDSADYENEDEAVEAEDETEPRWKRFFKRKFKK